MDELFFDEAQKLLEVPFGVPAALVGWSPAAPCQAARGLLSSSLGVEGEGLHSPEHAREGLQAAP